MIKEYVHLKLSHELSFNIVRNRTKPVHFRDRGLFDSSLHLNGKKNNYVF